MFLKRYILIFLIFLIMSTVGNILNVNNDNNNEILILACNNKHEKSEEKIKNTDDESYFADQSLMNCGILKKLEYTSTKKCGSQNICALDIKLDSGCVIVTRIGSVTC